VPQASDSTRCSRREVRRASGEEPPDDTSVVIRAGEQGFADQTVRRTAERSHSEFGFYGVSVFLALDMDVAALCASLDSLRRYSQIQESTAGQLRSAGFTLLATEARPHFDIVLAEPRGRDPCAVAAMLRRTQTEPRALVS